MAKNTCNFVIERKTNKLHKKVFMKPYCCLKQTTFRTTQIPQDITKGKNLNANLWFKEHRKFFLYVYWMEHHDLPDLLMHVDACFCASVALQCVCESEMHTEAIRKQLRTDWTARKLRARSTYSRLMLNIHSEILSCMNERYKRFLYQHFKLQHVFSLLIQTS